MEEPIEVERADADGGTRRRRWIWIIGAAVVGVAVVAVVGVIGVAGFHAAAGHSVPTFPSLAEAPDTSLRGTVAYFDNATRCVRVVAASGTPSKDVYCLPPEGSSQMKQLGKPTGPQLVWRPDGRLEVTLFRWMPSKDTKSPPPIAADWQKVFDVTTGAVADVPHADLPLSPVDVNPTTVNERGERIRTDFDAPSGQGKVTLTTPSGTRTLLSVSGPGEYTYVLASATWAPGGDWIATTDTGEGGRILVITPSQPPRTRILVANSGGGAGGGNAGPAFAVTGADLLTTTP
jgi:hypothetical protein